MDDNSELNDKNNNNNEDELSLPKATVSRMISEYLPKEIGCSKECRDLLTECCVEFIHLVSTQANDNCEKESKKTISPEHVTIALKELGFADYLPQVEEALLEYKEIESLKDKRSGKALLQSSGLSEEDLWKQQQQLFEKAKSKLAEQHS